MISVLAQERLLGAALGSILTGVVVFEHRRSIYRSISHSQFQVKEEEKKRYKSRDKEYTPREPIFGSKTRQEFAHIWNKSVDKTLGPLIESLSSRGW